MKLGIVFAGQGSQRAKMGLDFYEKYDSFRSTFDSFEDSERLKQLCFEEGIEELSRTINTQPALLAYAIAVTELLSESNINADIVAGLSLGEYSALYAAKVLSKDKLLELVKARACAMQEATDNVRSAMYAILGGSRAVVEKACKEASSIGVAEVCNYNSPVQIVISGEAEAVKKASELAIEFGAKRAIKLNVSGAFHTSLMSSAAEKLGKKLSNVKFEEMKIPVVFNTLGRIKNDGENIADLLEKQVKSSVYFEDSIRYMYENGVRTIIEVGPGKVLSGFIRKIQKDIDVYSIDTVEDFEAVVDKLGEING